MAAVGVAAFGVAGFGVAMVGIGSIRIRVVAARLFGGSDQGDQTISETGFPAPWCPGDANGIALSGQREGEPSELAGRKTSTLDHRDKTGKSDTVPRAGRFEELVGVGPAGRGVGAHLRETSAPSDDSFSASPS